MINLIPPAARRALTREYWFRVVSVWFFLLGFAFISVTILKMPSYMLVLSQSAQYNEQMNQANENLEESELSEAKIKLANQKANHLAAGASSTSFSRIINQLQSLAGGNITVAQVSLNKTDGVLNPIMINGIATDRAALTDFKNSIESDPLFSNAVLPIANLAQDQDISFQITITPVESKS